MKNGARCDGGASGGVESRRYRLLGTSNAWIEKKRLGGLRSCATFDIRPRSLDPVSAVEINYFESVEGWRATKPTATRKSSTPCTVTNLLGESSLPTGRGLSLGGMSIVVEFAFCFDNVPSSRTRLHARGRRPAEPTPWRFSLTRRDCSPRSPFPTAAPNNQARRRTPRHRSACRRPSPFQLETNVYIRTIAGDKRALS